MQHTILTMTRGDAHKIVEWVDYHFGLGFDDFQIILDGDIDGTEVVLRESPHSAAITIHRRDEVGDYFDSLSRTERWELIKAWRTRHRVELESGAMRGDSPVSWRQHLHFSDVMSRFEAGEFGKGWLALFDVDEFLVLPETTSIQQLTSEADTPRLRFLNFDVDTVGHDPSRPVLEQHATRWSHGDLVARGAPWSTRVKSMVRYKRARLDSTLHEISLGNSTLLDHTTVRIHHFRVPVQSAAGIEYSVVDPIAPRRAGTP